MSNLEIYLVSRHIIYEHYDTIRYNRIQYTIFTLLCN